MKELPFDATVRCTDGPAGGCTHLIFDPIEEAITHLVVHDGGFPEDTRRVVPVERVTGSGHDWIQLDCTLTELREMEPFHAVHFLPRESPPEYVGTALAWPWARPEGQVVPIETESVPRGELAIRRGAHVEAADGRVGRVGEFLISDDGHVTHLVLMSGHAWGKREVAIPLSMVSHAEEEAVHLSVGRAEIERLPDVEIERGYEV